MDCQNCGILRAKVACLESELARLRGQGVAPPEAGGDCVSTLQQRVFDNPSVSPGEIKSIDFLSLERELHSPRWESLLQGFSNWAADNSIKAVAFVVCFEKRVKGSKAVRALLNHLRDPAVANDSLQLVLRRSVFELFAIQVCEFSKEELQSAQSLLSDYLECSLSGEPDAAVLESLAQFLRSDEARAWEFIRQVVWPAFPTSTGPLQDRVTHTLVALVHSLQGHYMKSTLTCRYLTDKINSIQ